MATNQTTATKRILLASFASCGLFKKKRPMAIPTIGAKIAEIIPRANNDLAEGKMI